MNKLTLQECVEILDNGFLNFSRRLAEGDPQGANAFFKEAADKLAGHPKCMEALLLHAKNKGKLLAIRAAEREVLGQDLDAARGALREFKDIFHKEHPEH